MSLRSWRMVAAFTAIVFVLAAMPSGAAHSASRMQQSYAVPKTAVICLDVTLSVPTNIVPQSLQLLAREYNEQPHVGSPQFVAYVRTIRDNSVNPSNNLQLVDIPGVPKVRTTPVSNLDPNAVQTATTAHNRSLLNSQERSLLHARTLARAAAQKALHLKISPDKKQGTDLLACPAVAGRLLMAGGQNYLLVISDLIAYGRQHTDFADFSLPRTHVIVVDYCASDLRQCDGGESYFRHMVLKAGAADIRFYDSTQLPILNHLFNP